MQFQKKMKKNLAAAVLAGLIVTPYGTPSYAADAAAAETHTEVAAPSMEETLAEWMATHPTQDTAEPERAEAPLVTDTAAQQRKPLTKSEAREIGELRDSIYAVSMSQTEILNLIDRMQDIGILKQQGKVPSILNANTSATAILMNEIGSIEDAMNGKQTIVDLYMQTQKNHKALDATYRAAAERAKASQKVTEATNATVHDAVTMANNAEGQQQIMQAGIQIAAAGVLQGADQKELLAQLLAMQSEKWYIENTEKARDEARDHAMALKLHNFAGSH